MVLANWEGQCIIINMYTVLYFFSFYENDAKVQNFYIIIAPENKSYSPRDWRQNIA